MGSLSMGTGVPGDGRARVYVGWAPPLLEVRSCVRVFSRSEGRRRRGDSRNWCLSSRLGEEADGRCGRDILVLVLEECTGYTFHGCPCKGAPATLAGEHYRARQTSIERPRLQLGPAKPAAEVIEGCAESGAASGPVA
jgi:hypothetical protein